MDPFNASGRKVYSLAPYQKLAVQPALISLGAYFKSFQFEISASDRLRLSRFHQTACIFVLWHNLSWIAPEFFRRFCQPDRIHCLVSPSKNAAWEVAFFEYFRLRCIRGSTSRRSIPAMLEMLRCLKSGQQVGISPDGPAGPRYRFQSGAVRLARHAHVPVILCSLNCDIAFHLRSWDRHVFPPPFANITVALDVVPPNDPLWRLDDICAGTSLRARLLRLTKDKFTPRSILPVQKCISRDWPEWNHRRSQVFGPVKWSAATFAEFGHLMGQH